MDRILLDLGLSSDQLADADRGFGFEAEGPLDLRFDTREGQPAWEWIAEQTEEELIRVLETFGEEKFSKAIARELVQQAENASGEVGRRPGGGRDRPLFPNRHSGRPGNIPRRGCFKPLRIAVNRELEQVETALDQTLYEALKPGGRAVVISVSLAGRSNCQGRISGSKPMAEPHTAPPPRQPDGTADQPPLANGEAPGRPETPAAGTKSPAAAVTLSEARSQLYPAPATSAETWRRRINPAPPAEPQPPAEAAPAEKGGDEDWGIAPTRAGLSRETKMGFAFVLVLGWCLDLWFTRRFNTTGPSAAICWRACRKTNLKRKR